MLALKFRITCMFFKKFLIGRIHMVNSICQGKLIDLLEPFLFFLQFPVAVIVAVCFSDGLFSVFVFFFSICKCLVINKTAAAKCFCNL